MTHVVTTPANIQEELSRIWESLGTNKLRACLFNLIFYTENNERAGYIRTLAQKVVEKFPSRVIFVSVDKNPSNDYLRTKVSVLTASQGECEIACDLIEIDVAGSHQVRTPFVILPHILPDLPVYLVWAENPNKQNPISYQLEKYTTRIIFDSETTEDLPKFAKSILQHKETSQCDIADLNWGRTESWRDLFSTIFYSPERLAMLQKTKTITISYNSNETPFFCHTKIQSIYLQGWIACQLGWQLEKASAEKGVYNFYYRNKENSITVSLIAARSEKLSPGYIIAVDILTSDNSEFSFARHPQFPHQISVKLSTPEACEVPSQYLFAKAESGLSLVKEICHKGTSSHYLTLLNLISKMDGMIQC